PVLAYSYGNRISPPDRNRIYRESSGQEFWKELTGDDDFYLKLIRLMKDIPLKRKLEYKKIWDASINRFEREFIEEFCFENGEIDWEKLTQFVSKSSP
ncbi:MAG: PmeII family type II restriction endonuclease, partial [Nitrososphaerales archaeon]